MPKIYWMQAYNIKEDRLKDYIAFANSRAFKKLCADLERETGMKHVETYGTIIPSSREEGDYDAYELWELPNHAALDKLRESLVMRKMVEMSYEYLEHRHTKSVIMRKISDVKVLYEPKEKK
jgi:hypothetical protein